MRTKVKIMERPDGGVAVLTPNPRYRLWMGTPDSLMELKFIRPVPNAHGAEELKEVFVDERQLVIDQARRFGMNLETYMSGGFMLPKMSFMEIREQMSEDLHPLVRDDICFRQLQERFLPGESDDDHPNREYSKIMARDDINHRGFKDCWNCYPEDLPWWMDDGVRAHRDSFKVDHKNRRLYIHAG
jgi:hypothetical protein